MKNLYSLLTRKQERIGDGKKHGIIRQVKKGAWNCEKEKKDGALFAGNPGGREDPPVQAEQSGGRSGALEALPVYQLPEGCSVRWEKEEGGEPHTLYLPKKDGISYQYEESRKTGEDDGGI